MTREEAINIITKERDEDIFGGWTPHRKRIHEAFTLAIEALQIPPITQRSMYQAGYRQAQEDRPKGEWEEVDSFESEKHSVTDMRCSLCGKYASIVLPHGNRYVYDFCPNCGADMRKDGTDESNN